MASDNQLWLKDFLQDDLYLVAGEEQLFTSNDTPVPSPQPLPVAAVPVAGTIEETSLPLFNCLGPANSGFLILVNYTDDEHMPAGHLQALESILSRKNIVTGGFTILNTGKQKVNDHDAIMAHFSPQKLIVMGNGAIPAGLTAPQVNAVADISGIKFLYTYSFDEMLPSDDKKRAFWAEMKNF